MKLPDGRVITGLAGGVAGVYLSGGIVSIATTIGFITLFGIATRNGILLATRTAALEEEGVVTGLVTSTALNMVVISGLLCEWGGTATSRVSDTPTLESA